MLGKQAVILFRPAIIKVNRNKNTNPASRRTLEYRMNLSSTSHVQSSSLKLTIFA